MDAVARALAEPHRREILRLVHHDEMTVGTIADHFAVSRPAISQHLRILEEAELVTVRPAGTRRYYRARPDGLRGLHSWLEQFWSDRLADLKREVELDQRRDEGSVPATKKERSP